MGLGSTLSAVGSAGDSAVESVPGITVPAGDPEALEQAAGMWAGMADVFAGEGSRVFSAAGTLTDTSWSGEAGSAFSLYAWSMSDSLGQAAQGSRTAAAGCKHLASALREAQHQARAALRDAEDADRRRRAAETQLKDAQGRVDGAQRAAAGAQIRMDAAHAAGPGGHAAAQAASDDHARARTELTGAQEDERRAAGRHSDADHDLRIAQRHGTEANTHAHDASRRAEAAFHAAAHQLDVMISPISPPVPIDAARPAAPDLLASLTSRDGKSPNVFSDPLFPSYTPAEARSQQIQADEQRRQDAAPKHGNYFDALGGELKGLTGIRPFGDKNTQVYRTAEKVTNIAGYLPTPAAVERIGARLAIKEGEHLLAHQAERGVAKGASGATSALHGAQLETHLRLTEKYGSAGVRELENGRIRYYGDLRSARTPGEMAGQRTVREWDPATGSQRTWLETLDQQGRVRIVRPETGRLKRHYNFGPGGR